MDKVKSMVDSGLGYVKAETSNIYELSGCVGLAFLAHSQAIGGFNYAIIFAVLYALYGSQFNHRFRGNPAFTFADWLKDGELSCFDVFKQVIFQIGGYALGFLLGGLIGLTPHTPTAASDTSFTTMLFDEVLSVGVMVWLWLHVHDSDRNGSWKDFMGFATAAVIWMGYKLKLDGAHMNAAVFAGEDFGRSIGFWHENGWGIMDWAQFFAPLLACFFTTLVYTFYHK